MKPTYHIVSHSHWDREWYKSFSQFRAMLVNMVDDLLDLLQHDPTFACFTLDGQTVVLDDYLAVQPGREADIRRLVHEGRLLVGPWYVLPDEFLVSAEATVRNLLRGTRTARGFGGTMNVGYIPDSFGHIAMMPAILRGFGIDTALVYRGFGGEPGQTRSEYSWVSPDGTRSLMLHLFSNGYSTGYFHQEDDNQVVERFGALKAELDSRATTSQRLLMNGGDHHWPDPKLPRTLDLLRSKFAGEFKHSSIPQYVDAVKKEVGQLSTVSGELRFGYRYAFAVLGGVYSSRMYIKQANWQCQNLLQRYVEPFSLYAAARGMRSQSALTHQAWTGLMQNHPHDSICGCSIDAVHREMMTRFAAVQDTANAVLETSFSTLIPYDDIASKDDWYVFFVNPSPFPRTGVVKTNLSFYLQDVVVGLNPDVNIGKKMRGVPGFVLLDGQDREIPFQVLDHHEGYDITYSRYNYPKQTLGEVYSVLVDVRDVPPIGFKGLRIRKIGDRPRYQSRLKTGSRFIENDYLRIDVNEHGEVQVKDKKTGQRYSGFNVFEDSGDAGDEYNYSYPEKDEIIRSSKGRAKIRLVEKGPLRAALQIEITMRISASTNRKSRNRRKVSLPITSTVFLNASSRTVEFETEVVNAAGDHRLRVLFPSGIKTDTAYADSQFCVVERVQQRYDMKKFTIEHPAAVAPMQRFVTVRGEKHALTLFADGLPEYELKLDGKGTIALTLLRCVGLLSGSDLITRPGGRAGWYNETPDAQCFGRRKFRYAVLPHGSDENDGSALVNTEAELFHLPLIPIRRKNAGNLPLEGSFLSISTERIVLSALKEAEDGNGTIVRVYNPSASEAEGLIRFTDAVKEAAMVRLDEEPLEPAQILNGHDIHVHLGPSALCTLRVILS